MMPSIPSTARFDPGTHLPQTKCPTIGRELSVSPRHKPGTFDAIKRTFGIEAAHLPRGRWVVTGKGTAKRGVRPDTLLAKKKKHGLAACRRCTIARSLTPALNCCAPTDPITTLSLARLSPRIPASSAATRALDGKDLPRVLNLDGNIVSKRCKTRLVSRPALRWYYCTHMPGRRPMITKQTSTLALPTPFPGIAPCKTVLTSRYRAAAAQRLSRRPGATTRLHVHASGYSNRRRQHPVAPAWQRDVGRLRGVKRQLPTRRRRHPPFPERAALHPRTDPENRALRHTLTAVAATLGACGKEPCHRHGEI
ncbi:hypothetical protein B0I37DRAFT_198452 [Chaetomium sp. MPI-CAGE-AT-0009]|nr:hypothetical protein B0I37DRAFT_198452 [Chaetomium sp. MPI-CAGE-AT-0009]